MRTIVLWWRIHVYIHVAYRIAGNFRGVKISRMARYFYICIVVTFKWSFQKYEDDAQYYLQSY